MNPDNIPALSRIPYEMSLTAPTRIGIAQALTRAQNLAGGIGPEEAFISTEDWKRLCSQVSSFDGSSLKTKVVDPYIRILDTLIFADAAVADGILRLRQPLDALVAASAVKNYPLEIQWQPIETAPKDGTMFLGLTDQAWYRVQDCRWVVRETIEFGKTASNFCGWEVGPKDGLKPFPAPTITHWIPYPGGGVEDSDDGGLGKFLTHPKSNLERDDAAEIKFSASGTGYGFIGKWEPIETAPKDGATVLVYVPGLLKPVRLTYWFSSESRKYGKVESTTEKWAYHIGAWGNDPLPEPTHWMPLPEAPCLTSSPP